MPTPWNKPSQQCSNTEAHANRVGLEDSSQTGTMSLGLYLAYSLLGLPYTLSVQVIGYRSFVAFHRLLKVTVIDILKTEQSADKGWR